MDVIVIPDSDPFGFRGDSDVVVIGSDAVVIGSDVVELEVAPKRRRLMKKKDAVEIAVVVVEEEDEEIKAALISSRELEEDNLLLAFINSCSSEQFLEVLFLSQATKDNQQIALNGKPYLNIEACHDAIKGLQTPKSRTLKAIKGNYVEMRKAYSTVDDIIVRCEMQGQFNQ